MNGEYQHWLQPMVLIYQPHWRGPHQPGWLGLGSTPSVAGLSLAKLMLKVVHVGRNRSSCDFFSTLGNLWWNANKNCIENQNSPNLVMLFEIACLLIPKPNRQVSPNVLFVDCGVVNKTRRPSSIYFKTCVSVVFVLSPSCKHTLVKYKWDLFSD